MAAPDDDLDVVRAALGCESELDIDGALALTTDDLVLEFPFRGDGGPERLEGADAAAFMRALPTLFTRMQFSDVTLHERRRRVSSSPSTAATASPAPAAPLRTRTSGSSSCATAASPAGASTSIRW
jgi:ketosteroid isomerase-like protein